MLIRTSLVLAVALVAAAPSGHATSDASTGTAAAAPGARPESGSLARHAVSLADAGRPIDAWQALVDGLPASWESADWNAPLDRADLNDHPEIGQPSPTAERVAEVLAEKLGPQYEKIGGTLLSVSVWEGPDNRVDLVLE